MLSKNKISHIKSFHQKKVRDNEGVFIVEGNKMCTELLSSGFDVLLLVATPAWISGNINITNKNINELIEANRAEIERISLLQSVSDVFALVKIPNNKSLNIDYSSELIIALDCIQNPGNIGTILRTADWFGIKNIICSPDSVDVYNPKVVQASMGAVFRVNVIYRNLPEFLSEIPNDFPVYGTFLDGASVYTHELSEKGILILGNEGKGVSDSVFPFISNKIFIPSFSVNQRTSESLNVSVAAAIFCSEFKRRCLRQGNK
ncbi:MAG: hypothetical protein A2275_15785 [Bacteroidetes bacterium RIFOXYA12_FULL_35_11]|nr:MAG: hypothetical protein A2X01_19645 [Bacteroidetes bacterium GWF2_35_48]OFY81545.1 MAG: hypothetical protein A2275_15785 [Bacteroidetes bacterium RIFOXYA12_FULL_35_11]OFY94471.1 MAG: hypothetical protein A2491_00200 [Bacteroidetes bacterium RIFOXYC12_FULL_35_7]HBX53074.1 RNA methyltransferase [Bacteroidales bacterium]